MEQGHGSIPMGPFQRCHSHDHDITGSAKCPPEKQITSYWPIKVSHHPERWQLYHNARKNAKSL